MTETTAANSELLADQVSQLLVQPLEAASVVLSSGPRIFDTAGVLRIPNSFPVPPSASSAKAPRFHPTPTSTSTS